MFKKEQRMFANENETKSYQMEQKSVPNGTNLKILAKKQKKWSKFTNK